MKRSGCDRHARLERWCRTADGPRWRLAWLAAALAAAPILAAGPAVSVGWGAGSGGAKQAASGPDAVKNAPLIAVDNPVFNFGTVLSGPPVHHVFIVRNAGKGELIIGRVLPSCGCTAAAPSRTRLAPGEPAEIPVTVNTSLLAGPTTDTVEVVTNDPVHPTLTLKIDGYVREQVEATPKSIDFGELRRGTAASREVTLTPFAPHGFKVGAISNSNPQIRAERSARAASQGAVLLDVKLMPSMPVGPFYDTVKVETNRAPVMIDVFGTITGDLGVDPPQVSFGIVPHRQGALRIARLENRGPHAVKVLGIASSNRSVRADVEAVNPGQLYKIKVVLRRNTPDGQLRGNLTIRTDDPEQPSLIIPYYAIVGSFKG